MGDDSRVTFGNIAGGIHDSKFAGRDIVEIVIQLVQQTGGQMPSPRNLSAQAAALRQALPLLDPAARAPIQTALDHLAQAIADLPRYEQAYLDRLKNKYAQEAGYYIPLSGQTTEGLASLWRWPWLETEMPLWIRPDYNFDPLPPPPPTGWEETTIMAAGLAPENDDQLVQTLIRVNPVLAGRCLHEGKARVDQAIWQAVIQSLISILSDPEVALRVRIAAGEVLGYLGDPRLGEMVTIPAGKFLMADDHSKSDYEKPQHQLFLPEYQIGKYPLTNAEYQWFIEAGGYNNKHWWTEAGWEEIGQQQDEPSRWQDDRFNKPNQPVVNVSWYECVAYCRWLSTETGQLYRLPTEAEWEKAARGVDGRRYPWGNKFEAGRLNVKEGEQQVQTTTPVGIYPRGVSPFGLFDCAGNVLEWCATKAPGGVLYFYPYDVAEDEWSPDYVNARNCRVQRGGSWGFNEGYARCACRYLSTSNLDMRNGCRLAASRIG